MQTSWLHWPGYFLNIDLTEVLMADCNRAIDQRNIYGAATFASLHQIGQLH